MEHCVVFDVGSSSTRVGLSSYSAPLTFSTTISEDGAVGTTHGVPRRPVFNGGMVLNWKNWQKVLEHGFKLMEIEPDDYPVILNKSCYPNFRSHNEKIAQILFEEFNVPALHLNYSPVLSLYALGSLTGLVVESGFFETQFYPIYEGHILERTVTRGFPVAGDYLTYFLQETLQKKGFRWAYKTAELIKEKSFYLSKDLAREIPQEETFPGPDNSVSLSKEKYLIPEELYQSSIECGGMHEYLINTLYRCNSQLHQILFENIVLSGGNTLLPGFAERLEQELLEARTSFKFIENYTPKIVKNRQNSVWFGGAKLAALPTFPNMCLTKYDYNEHGPTFVHTKFF